MGPDNSTVRGNGYEPLSRFRLASAHRFEDALAIMSSQTEVYRISATSGGDACNFVRNYSSFAEMAVSYLTYGRPALVQAHGTLGLNIVWTASGSGSLAVRGRTLPVSTSQGVITHPHEEYAFRYTEQTGRTAFLLNEGMLEKYLAAAIGVLPRGRLRFHPECDMSAGPGAALKRVMDFIQTELDRPDAILTNPGAAAGLQDTIVAILLRHHPHSHSHYLQPAAKTAIPAVVRRVEEYLETQASEAVSMADLSLVAGIGLRAIQATFRKHRGYSPQQFLKSVRLKEANARLRSGRVMRVIDVAYDCGFAKLSSFSADYARRFGELPSVTLRRARGLASAG